MGHLSRVRGGIYLSALLLASVLSAPVAHAHDWSVGVYFVPGPYPQGAQGELLVAVINTDKSGQDRSYHATELGGSWWFISGALAPDPAAAGGFLPQSPVTLLAWAWPPSWEEPTFVWYSRAHVCTAACDDHYRSYANQDTVFSTNEWVACPYSNVGTQRYFVRVTWEGETRDSGVPRVSVRSADDFGLTGQDESSVRRRTYLQWLFSYLNVPYEWGGCWYGGYIGNCVGGGGAYDGYGIDCSGLVSCGAKRAGYNWHTGLLWCGWRYSTWSLQSVSYLVAEEELQPGHILLYPGVHVVSVYEIYDSEGATWVRVIHADGGLGAGARVRTTNSARSYWQDYHPRALMYTP